MNILDKCYYLPQIIESKTEEIKRLRELEKSIPGADPSREFISGGPKVQCRYAEIINKIVDLESEIIDEIEELVDLQKEARAIINAVKDDAERLVLMYYYIDGRTMEDIAEALGYSVRQAYRIKKAALSKLNV